MDASSLSLSLVLPAYNEAAVIVQAIAEAEAALGQLFADFEEWKKVWKPGDLLEWSTGFLRDYRRACFGTNHERVKVLPSKWSSPPADVVAISVDAAVRAEDRRIGLGIVARDSKGSMLGDKCDSPRTLSSSRGSVGKWNYTWTY